MKRFYGHFWRRQQIPQLCVLPTVRLTIGRRLGVGFQFLTAWFYVSLWESKHEGRGVTRMIYLLPYVSVHYHRAYGSGMSVQWLVWCTHFWLFKRHGVYDGE